MIVLGFDTATQATAVALRLPGGDGGELRDDPPQGAHPGHAGRLLGMAAELLQESGVSWAEVERIAVGLGPGTFTGLRVGVATARGLAQSLGGELVGVSSLAALAAGASGAAERVLAVIDARRGEVFAACYEAHAPAPRELAEPRALAPAAVADALPDPGPWLAVGDGAQRYRGMLESPAVRVAPEGSPLQLVRAEAICALGAAAAAPSPALELVLPDYRRRPDAQIALGAAAAGTRTHT